MENSQVSNLTNLRHSALKKNFSDSTGMKEEKMRTLFILVLLTSVKYLWDICGD